MRTLRELWVPAGEPVGPLAWVLACVLPAALLLAACDAPASGPVLDLPERPADAPGGEALAAALEGADLAAREHRIVRELMRGNVPAYFRRLRPVETTADLDGRTRTVTLRVTPDYLTLGSDDDSFVVPLTPQTAQRIADSLDAALPTPKMVDAIWAAAEDRLTPIRIPPDENMTSVRYFRRHDRLIRGQRRVQGVDEESFVAGHKKDVVITPRLAADPGSVAIYGWHRSDGEPLQPLSTALRDRWVGYNHGVRLVHRRILLDGEERDLLEVLRDPELAPLLSAGGAFDQPAYPVSDSRLAPSSEGFVPGAHGGRLFYRTYGSGEDTVVVVHGFRGDGQAYLAPELAEMLPDRTLLFYDQRGGGRSDPVPDDLDPDLADHAADLEAVRAAFELPRLEVVAHSGGAYVALQHALDHPDRLGRMALIAPGPPSPDSALRASVAGRAWTGAMTLVDRPVLVLHGSADAVPVAAAEAWARALPDARLEVVEGADDLPWLGRPAEVGRLLRDFLDAPRGGPRSIGTRR